MGTIVDLSSKGCSQSIIRKTNHLCFRSLCDTVTLPAKKKSTDWKD